VGRRAIGSGACDIDRPSQRPRHAAGDARATRVSCAAKQDHRLLGRECRRFPPLAAGAAFRPRDLAPSTFTAQALREIAPTYLCAFVPPPVAIRRWPATRTARSEEAVLGALDVRHGLRASCGKILWVRSSLPGCLWRRSRARLIIKGSNLEAFTSGPASFARVS